MIASISLTGIATGMISSLGYGGLALGLIVDSAGVPIPSEVLLPISGALVNTGRFDFWLVVAVGTLAQTAGAILAYWLGATGGLALADKYGKYVFFSKRELHITEKYFSKYGQWLTLAGRCLPVIRTYIGFPAGLARMNFAKFLTASFVGSLLWTLFLTQLGVSLGTPDRLHAMDEIFKRFNVVIIALLLLGVIWYVRRHLKHTG